MTVDQARRYETGLEKTLADPATYVADAGLASRTRAALDAAAGEVARLTARWEELEARSSIRK